MAIDPGQLLTLAEVRAKLNLSPETLRHYTKPELARAIGLPALPTVRIGRVVRVRGSALIAWLEAVEGRGR